MGRKQVSAPAAVEVAMDTKKKVTEQQSKQGQRQQKQKQSAGGLQHYTAFLQVYVLDIDHTSPSVLLFFNKERYMFNAGEGIQRLCREHRVKITQVDAYMVTRISTETLGGLPGMALAVSPPDAAGLLDRKPVCTVKGPPGLSAYVDAFRGYINHENHVAVEEFATDCSEPAVRTDVVSITPIVVRVAARQQQKQRKEQATAAAAAANDGGAAASPSAAPNSPNAMEDGNGNDSSNVHANRNTEEASQVGAAAAGAGDDGPAAKRQRTGRSPSSASMSPGGEDPEGPQRPAGLSPPDVVVYAVQLAGRPGKFDPDRAKQLGVVPGPAFGQLQRGTSVTTPDGRLVTPSEVMEPEVPGPTLLVLDTPDRESLEAVAADERVRRFVVEAASGGDDSANRLCFAVHLLPPSLAADQPCVASFREQLLGSCWRHLVVTPGSVQPSSIPRATVFQAKLHSLSPTCFPIFACENATTPPAPPEAELEAAAAAAKQAVASAAVAAAASKAKGKAGGTHGGGGEAEGKAAAAAAAAAVGVATQQPVLPYPPAGGSGELLSAVRVNLMPPTRQGLEYGDVFRYDSAAKVLEAMAADPAAAAVRAAVEEVRQAVAAAAAMPREEAVAAGVPEAVATGDRRQMELTFLGTASSQPSKYRNVSGTYVDLFDRGGLLVDCGEDAMGQMKRRFGDHDAECRLGEGLGLVWVSHMHADHHGGLYRLLEWRARRGLPPLLVVGPSKLFEVLVRYSAAVPIKFIFLRNNAVWRPDGGRPPPPVATEALSAALRRLGLAELTPFPVHHIYDAHGLRLRGEAGWVAVFSGDTRPCDQTVTSARGATLLVHEATFEESMQEEAMAKRHSTTAEAVSIGERAGAYRTILTHFSTRYPTLPELDLSPHPSVAVAMDLMSVNLADLPWLPRLVRPLGLLFRRMEEEKAASGEQDDDD